MIAKVDISLKAQAERGMELLRGRFRGWVDANLRALQRVRPLLTPENQRVLDEFQRARRRHVLARLQGLHRAGVYRQTRRGNIGIVLASLINRL